ncbi:MAG: hypothetical protein JRN52_09545 [Nitrososphaerota archaeon]|nr:hypothetical protein [Nitrososphaerota archaeon]
MLVSHKRKTVNSVFGYSALVGLLYSLVWTVSGIVTHQISTPGFLFYSVIAVTLAIWFRAHLREIDHVNINFTCLQMYAIGTFGIFSSDVLRIIAAFLNIQYLGLDVTPAIIGANGPYDAVFLGGLSFALIFVMGLLVLSIVRTSARAK